MPSRIDNYLQQKNQFSDILKCVNITPVLKKVIQPSKVIVDL